MDTPTYEPEPEPDRQARHTTIVDAPITADECLAQYATRKASSIRFTADKQQRRGR
ncbi:hypothetical protein ACFVZH_22515 [Streptomyces sp. NPDC059534]|uniref:hypothetical protein n=1 Tax=Streptomyces sp. NPDC059534 TaxID=3346859 RepID=UPI0036C89296